MRLLSALLPQVKFNLSKFLQMRLNSWLIRWLPFSWSRWYLILLGRLYYFWKRREKELILRTLAFVWDRRLSSRDFRRLCRQTFHGIFDHYHEKLFLAYASLKRVQRFLSRRLRLVNEEALQEALAQGKGVILATGHFGAVEFLPAALALNGYKVAIICRFQTSRLRDTLVARAQGFDLKIIDADHGNCLLAALKALKEGRIIITESDEFEEWKAKDDHKLTFLGATLNYDRALDILSKRSGAPVVSALICRQGKEYHLHLDQITPLAASLPRVGESCLALLEQFIQNYPQQWYQWKKFGQMIEPQLGQLPALEPASLVPQWQLGLVS